MDKDISALQEQVEKHAPVLDRITAEVGKVIVGQKYMVERLLIGLLADGHILLEGVPGLAKTLAVSTLARTVEAKFQRIQFTPDALPADITGTLIYQPQEMKFVPRKGPIFANLILADEINRAPAKVQSALLEAMQERQVTIGETTYPLPKPFLVLATQNPIEQEGTYPLPEAQVDRFMLKLSVGYPSRDEELEILNRVAVGDPVQTSVVVKPEEILKAREAAHRIYVDERVKKYIVSLVHCTRKPSDFGLKMDDLVRYGASPRASIYLTKAAQAYAFLKHRAYVTPEDVKVMGPDVLRHRILRSYEAEAEGIGVEDIIRGVFDTVEAP
jgi:MoxR-like ATPase